MYNSTHNTQPGRAEYHTHIVLSKMYSHVLLVTVQPARYDKYTENRSASALCHKNCRNVG